MNGQFLRELPIAVDRFKVSREIQFYFLTHMHADHTVGLTSWWQGEKVYCTLTSAKMLHYKIKLGKNRIAPLEELHPYILQLKIKGGYINLSVTVIPANHCPGACMFLFETNTVKILYTGDFRPNAQIYEIGKDLWGPKHRPIDVLYVDNTYCEPACVFPSREEATKMVIKTCKKYPKRKIYIGTNWIGHEELLETIAIELKQYIYTTARHMEFLKLIGRKNVFTSDPEKSNIIVAETYMINQEHMKELNEKEECIGIRPTARTCHMISDTSSVDLIHTVPYSNHSSFSELWEFVKSVRPRLIKPVVKGKTSFGMDSHFRANMSQFNCLLNREEIDTPRENQYVSPTVFLPVNRSKNVKPKLEKRVQKRMHVCFDRTKVNKDRVKKPRGVVYDEND